MRRLLYLLAALAVLVPLSLRGQGKFSGLSYFDYYYNVTRPSGLGALPNNALSGAKDMQAFQIRRFFFTYDDNPSTQLSTRFRIDADQSALATDGRITVYLKDASLTWKDIFRGSNLTVGLQPTPPFEVIEGVWNYRAIEKTILDLRGLVSTRDMGISLGGRIDREGIVDYRILIGDNSASKPASTKYRRYYGQIVLRPVRDLVIALYGDYNDRASIDDPYISGTLAPNGVLTADGTVGFTVPGRFSVGVEVSHATAFHGYDDGTMLANLQALGISGFGSVNFVPSFALVGRFDYFDPNINANVLGDSRNYAVAGISWQPMPALQIIPNVLYEMYERMPNGTLPTAAMTARLTFSYVYL